MPSPVVSQSLFASRENEYGGNFLFPESCSFGSLVLGCHPEVLCGSVLCGWGIWTTDGLTDGPLGRLCFLFTRLDFAVAFPFVQSSLSLSLSSRKEGAGKGTNTKKESVVEGFLL